MSEPVCPQCRAAINPDLVDDDGRVECPFCNNEWSLLELPQSPCETFFSESATGATLSDATSLAKSLPALPPGSQIKVVEATDDRLVLYVPGGGKQARGLGCFAIFWNGFMCLFTPMMLVGVLQGGGNDAPPVLGLVAFLGLFWAVGLGMAWFAVKFKYERTFLLVDRDRLVVQRVLFSRKRIEATDLEADSRAALVESYQQNDNPVYRVEVQGTNRAAKFGTSLGDPEKDWLVDRLNDFLGRGGAWALETPPTAAERAAAITAIPRSCRHCGAPLTGDLVKGAVTCTHCGGVFRAAVTRPADALPVVPLEQLLPAELPPESPLHVDEDSSDVLQLHYLLASGSAARWLVPLITLPFSLAWYWAVFAFLGGAWQAPFLPVRIVAIVFSIPFLLVGLLPFAAGLVMLRGRTTIKFTPETLACRWHAGWIGYSRSIGTAAIDEIRVQAIAPAQQNPRVRSARQIKAAPEWKVCVARAGGRRLYLSLFLDETTSRQIAALLRTRLEDWGHVLADA